MENHRRNNFFRHTSARVRSIRSMRSSSKASKSAALAIEAVKPAFLPRDGGDMLAGRSCLCGVFSLELFCGERCNAEISPVINFITIGSGGDTVAE